MGSVIELQPDDFERVARLFDVFDSDRSLIGGVLEGKQVGRVFCEDARNPRFAALFQAGMYGYLAGDPEVCDLHLLAEVTPQKAGVDIAEVEYLLPQNTSWIAHLINTFGERLKRDAYEYFTFTEAKVDWIKKWPDRIPDNMQVVRMDRALARKAEKKFEVAGIRAWGSVERFLDGGFGFVIVADEGELAGTISSFAIGEGEAEIDIATDKKYRRRGLATLMGCAFISRCMDNGLTPSWTANFGNFASMATARKLGFVDRFILPCFTIEDKK